MIAQNIRETGRPRRGPDGRLVKDAQGGTLMEAGPSRMDAVSATGWYIPEYGRAQVSINLTDFRTTPPHAVFEVVEKEAEALSERPVVHLRVNTLKTTRDDAIAALKNNDIQAFAAPYSPTGLRVPEPSDVAGSKPFHDGLVEFQDEGAQLASLLCDARPGQRVVDYCAGAGRHLIEYWEVLVRRRWTSTSASRSWGSAPWSARSS